MARQYSDIPLIIYQYYSTITKQFKTKEYLAKAKQKFTTRL